MVCLGHGEEVYQIGILPVRCGDGGSQTTIERRGCFENVKLEDERSMSRKWFASLFCIAAHEQKFVE
jgi:hypothetical protein